MTALLTVLVECVNFRHFHRQYYMRYREYCFIQASYYKYAQIVPAVNVEA